MDFTETSEYHNPDTCVIANKQILLIIASGLLIITIIVNLI